jgi:riboflavin kinase/FMN adenylyltransferase
VRFVHHLRPQMKFDGVDALIEQMHNDVARTRELMR